MGESTEEKEILQQVFYIMLLAILFLKFIVEAYFEKINPPIGHNTGIVVFVGMLCSMTIYLIAKSRK